MTKINLFTGTFLAVLVSILTISPVKAQTPAADETMDETESVSPVQNPSQPMTGDTMMQPQETPQPATGEAPMVQPDTSQQRMREEEQPMMQPGYQQPGYNQPGYNEIQQNNVNTVEPNQPVRALW